MTRVALGCAAVALTLASAVSAGYVAGQVASAPVAPKVGQWSPGDRLVPLPACVQEDGSGGPVPCLWDGAKRGNGHGLTYVITTADGDAIYFTGSPR